ncbi:Melanoma-associated antigen 10-like protein [Drosera capensis]
MKMVVVGESRVLREGISGYNPPKFFPATRAARKRERERVAAGDRRQSTTPTPPVPQATTLAANNPHNSLSTQPSHQTQILQGMAASREDFDLSKEELDKLIAEVIRYVIFKNHQNSGCPIKREELTQIVTKNYQKHLLPAFVIDEARKKIKNIFGYEMKELQRARSSAGVMDAKTYVITSQIPAAVYSKHVDDLNTAHLNGLTFVIISIVHLTGGKISEEDLWHLLKRMGLHEKDERHPVFGNTKLSLESLVQQRYLQKTKANGPEGNTFLYELAERALDESISQKMKEYISKIVNTEVGVVEID